MSDLFTPVAGNGHKKRVVRVCSASVRSRARMLTGAPCRLAVLLLRLGHWELPLWPGTLVRVRGVIVRRC
jgi:hypothetical protein